MGVITEICVVVGIDARAPGTDGRSVMDRYLAGEFGEFYEEEGAEGFPEWMADDPFGPDLKVHTTGAYTALDDPGAAVLIGTKPLSIIQDNASAADGPLSLPALKEAEGRVRAALAERGFDLEPRVWLLHHTS